MKPDTNAREISLSVPGCPPKKDGANSIFNQKHSHHRRVVDLLQKAKQALADSRWDPRERTPIGLELIIAGVSGDLDNYLGGVADVLKATKPNESAHLVDLAEVSFYIDDEQIEEMRGYVDRGGAPCYRVRVWALR